MCCQDRNLPMFGAAGANMGRWVCPSLSFVKTVAGSCAVASLMKGRAQVSQINSFATIVLDQPVDCGLDVVLQERGTNQWNH